MPMIYNLVTAAQEWLAARVAAGPAGGEEEHRAHRAHARHYISVNTHMHRSLLAFVTCDNPSLLLLAQHLYMFLTGLDTCMSRQGNQHCRLTDPCSAAAEPVGCTTCLAVLMHVWVLLG